MSVFVCKTLLNVSLNHAHVDIFSLLSTKLKVGKDSVAACLSKSGSNIKA